MKSCAASIACTHEKTAASNCVLFQHALVVHCRIALRKRNCAAPLPENLSLEVQEPVHFNGATKADLSRR
jgi:hypothetical protein